MLIAELFDAYPNFMEEKPKLADLMVFYQNAKRRFDTDPEFKKTAQLNVVLLQSGDEKCVKGWKLLCEISRLEFEQIYKRLDVVIEDYGESFYNPLLKPLCEELEQKGIIVNDNGAKCIFIPKQKVPLIMQKSDGGYNYDTTDIAAIRYRIEVKKADQIVYITDAG